MDAKELLKQCEIKITEAEKKMQREIEQQYQEKLRRKKKITIIAILIVILAVLITVGIIIFSVVISPSMKYNQAISDFNNGNYLEAADPVSYTHLFCQEI